MGKNQHVTKRPDGKWQVIGEGNSRATSIADTQEAKHGSAAPRLVHMVLRLFVVCTLLQESAIDAWWSMP